MNNLRLCLVTTHGDIRNGGTVAFDCDPQTFTANGQAHLVSKFVPNQEREARLRIRHWNRSYGKRFGRVEAYYWVHCEFKPVAVEEIREFVPTHPDAI